MKRYTLHGVIAVVIGLLGLGMWTVAAPAEDKVRKNREGRVTEPLRAEHRQLLPHIQALRTAGDSVGTATTTEQVHESYLFLTGHLIPHAVAEDEVLYVEVDRLIGKNGDTRATDTMRRDHQEVGALTEQLGTLARQLESGTLTEEQQRDLRRVLYSLHGIVTLHFAKEEEVYLPLLDRKLTAEQAQHMFEQMERITKDKGAGGHTH